MFVQCYLTERMTIAKYRASKSGSDAQAQFEKRDKIKNSPTRREPTRRAYRRASLCNPRFRLLYLTHTVAKRSSTQPASRTESWLYCMCRRGRNSLKSSAQRSDTSSTKKVQRTRKSPLLFTC